MRGRTDSVKAAAEPVDDFNPLPRERENSKLFEDIPGIMDISIHSLVRGRTYLHTD